MKYLNTIFVIVIFSLVSNCTIRRTNILVESEKINIIFNNSDRVPPIVENKKQKNDYSKNLIDSLNNYFPNAIIKISYDQSEIDSFMRNSPNVILISKHWGRQFHNSSNNGVSGQDYFEWVLRIRIDMVKKFKPHGIYLTRYNINKFYKLYNQISPTKVNVTQQILIDKWESPGYQKIIEKLHLVHGIQNVIEITPKNKDSVYKNNPNLTKIHLTLYKEKTIIHYVNRKTNQIIKEMTLIK